MAETEQTTIETSAPEPFCSFAELSDAHSELLQREMTTENREQYLKEAQNLLERGRETGAVLDDLQERYTAQSILNYWLTVLYRAERGYTGDTTLASFNPSVTITREGPCPYPGVRAFNEDEDKYFFGRQRQINYMLSRLREDRLLAIVGPSGTGKTSLLRAGLLPQLKQSNKLDQRERFYYDVITPGREPLQALQKMIEGAGGPSDTTDGPATVDSFRRDTSHLLKLIEKQTALPVLIFIDQFHEIFTLANFGDRRAFLANLGKVMMASGPPHTIVAVMRDINYDQYLERPERFRQNLDAAKVSLPSLSSLELRDAIEKPGSYVGMKFPEPVTKALLNEIIGEPNGLPLLQFTLCKLAAAHTNNEDIQKAFDAMVGCRENLAKSAEDFYNTLDSFDSVVTRRLMTRLFKFDEEDLKPVLRAATRAELRPIGLGGRLDSIIERLADNQLIRISRAVIADDDEIELVHESLLRSWPRMKGWVETAAKRRKRVRIAVSAFGLVGLAALVLLLTFAFGWILQGNKSRELARISKQHLANDRFDRALLLGLAAHETEANTVTRGTLLKLLYNFQFTPKPVRFLVAENFAAQDLSFSNEKDGPPGKLAAVDISGKILIWNLSWTGDRTGSQRFLVEASDAFLPIVFSPDGQHIATASSDPKVAAILWNIETGQPTRLMMSSGAAETGPASEETRSTNALAFSNNGKTLFTGGSKGTITQWDIAEPSAAKPKTLLQHSTEITTMVLNSSGDRLAFGDDDGAVIVLDPNRNRPLPITVITGHETEFEGDEPIYNLAFDQTGTLLAAGRYMDHGVTATVWDLQLRKLVQEVSTGLFSGLVVSFVGDRLTGFTGEGVLFSWNLEHGSGTTDWVFKPLLTATSASFSTDGKFVAVPRPDGAIIWDLSNRRFLSRNAQVKSIAFSPNRQEVIKLLVGDRAGLTVLQAELDKEERELTEQTEGSGVNDVAYSADGTRLAAALDNGSIRIRDANKLDAPAVELHRDLTNQQVVESVDNVAFDPVQKNRLAAVVRTTNLVSNEEDVADETHQIVLWDVATGTQMSSGTNLPAIDRTRKVVDIVFRPDGKQLVWSTTDGTQAKITIWDLATNRLVKELDTGSQVFSLAFDSRSELLAAGLAKGEIAIWKVSDLDSRTTLDVGSGEVAAVAFSPENRNGTVLACATNPEIHYEGQQSPGTITLWDVDSREQLGDSLKGHNDAISSIAFSLDGNILASAGLDKTVRLWGPLNVEHAGRFREVVDFSQTYVKDCSALDNEWFFQRFYRWVMGRKSLREIHQVKETTPCS